MLGGVETSLSPHGIPPVTTHWPKEVPSGWQFRVPGAPPGQRQNTFSPGEQICSASRIVGKSMAQAASQTVASCTPKKGTQARTEKFLVRAPFTV